MFSSAVVSHCSQLQGIYLPSSPDIYVPKGRGGATQTSTVQFSFPHNLTASNLSALSSASADFTSPTFPSQLRRVPGLPDYLSLTLISSHSFLVAYRRLQEEPPGGSANGTQSSWGEGRPLGRFSVDSWPHPLRVHVSELKPHVRTRHASASSCQPPCSSVSS